VPDISVVLPSILHPLAGGQSILTAPAEGPVTVGKLLDTVTKDYPVLARRLRDETGSLRRHVNIYVDGDEVLWVLGLDTGVAPGQEVVIFPSVAGG
jgi:molybdopterin synthase sulfur carrier subunit